jgi:hypothetical protein
VVDDGKLYDAEYVGEMSPDGNVAVFYLDY